MPCAQKRLQSSTEGVVYPLHPDQREFFCIVKKVNDARNHESAAAHLLRDAEYVAQWAARSQQAAEARDAAGGGTGGSTQGFTCEVGGRRE